MRPPIEGIAADLAGDLDRLIDSVLHDEKPKFEELEDFLWDNKVGILRVLQHVAKGSAVTGGLEKGAT